MPPCVTCYTKLQSSLIGATVTVLLLPALLLLFFVFYFLIEYLVCILSDLVLPCLPIKASVISGLLLSSLMTNSLLWYELPPPLRPMPFKYDRSAVVEYS